MYHRQAVGLRAATLEVVDKLLAPTREVIAAQKALFEMWLNKGLAESIETSKDVFARVFEPSATRDATGSQ